MEEDRIQVSNPHLMYPLLKYTALSEVPHPWAVISEVLIAINAECINVYLNLSPRILIRGVVSSDF
jgi:hypothetical protein